MLNLSDYTFDKVSVSQDHCATHLGNLQKVAITPSGMREHIQYAKTQRMLVGFSIGAALIPFTIGGGIGVVGALGAGAIGLFEQALIGGVVSGLVGGGLKDQSHANQRTKLNKATALDMVGVVRQITGRNTTEDGHDVEVMWFTHDDYGNEKTVTSWHNPDHLIGLEPKAS